MSELIDRNVLKAKMYQEAFESDTDMQKWDSGCWIRYKLFEKVVDSTPTVPYGPRWHRVEDQLPRIGQLVIAIDSDGHVNTAILSARGGWWISNVSVLYSLCRVLYWMPLPEPPKEDEE